MAIPLGTPSLLLTLLKDVQVAPSQYFNSFGIDPSIAPTVQRNIDDVVGALDPRPFRRNLIKDVAQEELYDVLYEVIEKEYENPGQDSRESSLK